MGPGACGVVDGGHRRVREREPRGARRLEAARLHGVESPALTHEVRAVAVQDHRDVDPVGGHPGVLAVEAAVAKPEMLLDVVDHDGAEPGVRRGAAEEGNRRSGAVERHGRPGIDGRQLFEDDRPHEGADLDPAETERRELPDELGRHTARPLVGAHARQQAVLGEAARRLLDEPLLLGEGEREAHAGFLGGSETRSVPCATQASWSPFVTSTRTTAVRRPSATTVDSATTVPPRTGAR